MFKKFHVLLSSLIISYTNFYLHLSFSSTKSIIPLHPLFLEIIYHYYCTKFNQFKLILYTIIWWDIFNYYFFFKFHILICVDPSWTKGYFHIFPKRASSLFLEWGRFSNEPSCMGHMAKDTTTLLWWWLGWRPLVEHETIEWLDRNGEIFIENEEFWGEEDWAWDWEKDREQEIWVS